MAQHAMALADEIAQAGRFLELFLGLLFPQNC